MHTPFHENHRYSGPMTALITPFCGDGVDYVAFDHLVQWQIDQGMNGLVLNTLIAEGPTLKIEERRSLISRCVQLTRGRIPVVAATGTNSTATTIERSIEAEILGVDALLVVQPYYSRPGQKGIVHHFEEVAGNVQLPILIHNDPGHAAVEMNRCTLEKLLKISGVIGLVDDTCVSGRELKDSIADDFIYLCGNDLAVEDMLITSDGLVSTVANVCPFTVSMMHRALKMGDMHHARPAHRELQLLAEALSLETAAASVKHALSCLRGIDGKVRLPITDVSDETADAIMAALKPFWSTFPKVIRSHLVLEAITARLSKAREAPF
jgi:4-hydroxy-tetrahydrodipicolinate synthase